MNINIKNFKNVVTKGTMNFGIETLQLRFGNGRITSNMLSRTGTSIAILNVENNIIDIDEELVWNFSEPAADVVPYLNLIDDDSVELQCDDVFMNLVDRNNRVIRITFCSENAVRRLGTDDVQNTEWFFEMPIDIDFIRNFEKIKRIGARFGKVYFSIKDKKLVIETTDKTNMYSQGYTVPLADVDIQDVSLAYVYTDVVNFFHCIEMDLEKGFTLKIEYKEDQGLGCIYALSENGEEKYSLISRDSL